MVTDWPQVHAASRAVYLAASSAAVLSGLMILGLCVLAAVLDNGVPLAVGALVAWCVLGVAALGLAGGVQLVRFAALEPHITIGWPAVLWAYWGAW